MLVSIICAIDENNGLGNKNQLLCHLPADLKYFKKKTLHKSIIMGYNTYASIGKPLPQRQNIVISRKQDLQLRGIEVVPSLEQALKQSGSDEVMVIGGGMVYREALPKADKLYVTRIHHRFEADVFFPKIDERHWRLESEVHHPRDEKNRYDYSFETHIRTDDDLQ